MSPPPPSCWLINCEKRTLQLAALSAYRLLRRMLAAIVMSTATAMVRACLLVSHRWSCLSVVATITSSLSRRRESW